MADLGSWMNRMLVRWGVEPHVANLFDETILALLMVAAAVGIDYLLQWLVIGGLKRLTRRNPRLWNTLLIKHKVLRHLIHTVPGILVYLLLPVAFERGRAMLHISQKLCSAYIIFCLLLAINGLLSLAMEVFERKGTAHHHPVKGFIQVLQVLVFFVGGIVIISIFIDRSPVSLFAGLGASAAVLLLVFRDTILGFVAGIQLSVNDMVRLGDWIEVPSSQINGTVIEITLNTVKVRNWDNTIGTIPPYTLVNTPFKNWRGMEESGGRRVNKSLLLDVHSIRFLDAAETDALLKQVPLLAGWQPTAGDPSTNAQLFRIYIERYLRSLKEVNTDLDLIISQLPMTEYGVGLQLYFFSRNKAWADYERIQSDICDHLIGMVPAFSLKLYQEN